jgi:hypothetical protein
MKKTVLFYRNYKFFSGGHLKVHDYFNHVRASTCFQALIHLTCSSSPENPWKDVTEKTNVYCPERADILFIAGLDWTALEQYGHIEKRVPVVNLIQGVRHAVPTDPCYRYLEKRAVRICVSEEVAAAIRATRKCNGPIHAIPNGLGFGLLPLLPQKDIDVFIAGLKKPNLAGKLASRLMERGIAVDCVRERLERNAFLQRMSRARIAIALPLDQEGFFCPRWKPWPWDASSFVPIV